MSHDESSARLRAQAPELLLESAIPQWSHSTDVLVVGYGAAGASAAIAAREAGAQTLVLERASGAGGASGIAGGHIYMGGGTPVQTACGFEDSAEDMYRYLEALTPDPDPLKIRLYCEQSVAHFHWLEQHGVPFDRSYYPGKAAMQPGKDCLIWSGNEKVWPYRERARPAPRGHKVAFDGPDGGGALLMQCLARAAEQAGVEAWYDTRVTHLVAAAGGRVVGVRALRDGTEVFIRSRGGVVLAAGGYIMNEDIFEHELAWMPRDLIKHGTPHDDGAAILLGLSAGAAAQGMDRAFLTSPFYPPENMIKGILVNAAGKRFVAEDSYHGRSAGFIVEQPQGTVYLILDSATFGYPPYDFFEQRLVDGFESIAEMESGLALPQGSLQQTMADYNAHAARGEDPDFHKYKDWLQPLDQGPWAAFDLSVGRARYAGFSLGGLSVSADAEARDDSGASIPGLYAAGACAWNIAQDARGYSSGTCLGEATFFGRRAGEACARND
jgi:3-oxo-5alpha-steroid 4-dehydrogenase